MENKGMGGHQLNEMKTDEWLTPPEIIKSLGEFDLDPCCPINRPWDTAKKHYSKNDGDGLLLPWLGRVWCNPPYGRVTCDWLEKCSLHGNAIVLIFARMETRMFFNWVWPYASAMLFMQGRIHFYNVDGIRSKANSGAPSVLVAYGEYNSKILGECGIPGIYLKDWITI